MDNHQQFKMSVFKVNLLAFFFLLVSLYILLYHVSPVERGFFCADSSLRYPYISQEFDNIAVLVISLLLTLSCILADKLLYSNVPLKCLLLELIPFFFGYLVNLTINRFVKVITGRLRPFFIEFCKPDSLANCYDPKNSSHLLRGVYMETFHCTNDLQSSIDFTSSQDSFYSFRASLMAFTTVYLVCYLQNHLYQLNAVFRGLLQFLLLNLACFIGYTAVRDYHAFWDDVAVGLLAGTIIALGTYSCVQPVYRSRTRRSPRRTTSVLSSSYTNHQSPRPAPEQASSITRSSRSTHRQPLRANFRLRQLLKSQSIDSESTPLTNETETHPFYQTL